VIGASEALSSTTTGVVSVILRGERETQSFEFAFEIADLEELATVEERLRELVHGRVLSIAAIETFIDCTRPQRSVRGYRDGVVNYFYGVLAREGSPESGLVQRGSAAYSERFDDAVNELQGFDLPTADAICGLVAFHYNQFDIARRRTHSPRVARAAQRFAALLSGAPSDTSDLGQADRASLDFTLSDAKTEQVLAWCCVPLDGSSDAAVRDMEAAVDSCEPADQLKLHIIAAEHHLAAAQIDRANPHLSELRNSAVAEAWMACARERAEDPGS
jgi:hypothetical protein